MGLLLRSSRLRRVVLALFFVTLGVALSLVFVVVWSQSYPDPSDPKNIYYVLWKHRLNKDMNIDSALAAMSHDVWPVRQVEGLTEEQLKARFGFVRTLDEATPYLRDCYSTPGSAAREETSGNKEDVMFLRDSPWMVVMKNGKAVDLVMCKGY
ncbi:MAG: hypothetical protein ACRD8A_10760 [Candidatus Acidiferrales bacterium]